MNEKDEFVNQVFDWGSDLDTNIGLYTCPDVDFKKQLGKQTKYTPTISKDFFIEKFKIKDALLISINVINGLFAHQYKILFGSTAKSFFA